MKKERIIFLEEDKSSLSQENEIDLQNIIDDFMQESNNNINSNNDKLKKNNIYRFNSYYNKKIENKKLNVQKNEISSLHEMNNDNTIYDNYFSKKFKQNHLKKIFYLKHFNNNNSMNSGLNNFVDKSRKYKRAKSSVNCYNNKNKNIFKSSLVPKSLNNSKNQIKAINITSKNLNKNRKNNLLLNKKINNLQYKGNKEINNIISHYEKNGNISFNDLENIFNELKLFLKKKLQNDNEKIKYGQGQIIQKNYDIKIDENYSTQNTTNNNTITINLTPYSNITKEKDEKLIKQKEKEFYRQLWMIFSNSKEIIESNKFIELLNILYFANNFNITSISNKIKKYIFSNENIKNKKFIYPLTKKEISNNKIWPLETLIKEYIELFSIYKININNDKVYKLPKYNYQINENKSFFNSSKHSNEKPDDFLYQKYKNKFGRIKNYKKDIIQELSFQPKINKDFFIKNRKQSKSKNKNINESTKKININNININNININNISIFEKLYNQDKVNRDKKRKLIEDNLIFEEIKSLEECTFKPHIISNNSFRKIFNNNSKPKGYEEYKHKIREAIAEAERRKIEKNK